MNILTMPPLDGAYALAKLTHAMETRTPVGVHSLVKGPRHAVGHLRPPRLVRAIREERRRGTVIVLSDGEQVRLKEIVAVETAVDREARR